MWRSLSLLLQEQVPTMRENETIKMFQSTYSELTENKTEIKSGIVGHNKIIKVPKMPFQ